MNLDEFWLLPLCRLTIACTQSNVLASDYSLPSLHSISPSVGVGFCYFKYFCVQLAVDFYVESSADDTTLKTVEEFSGLWGNRGPVQTHFRVLKGGLIRAVTESFYPADR